MSIRFAILFLLCVNPLIAGADKPDTDETPARIQNAVIQFIESNLRHKYSKFSIDSLAINPHLRLQRCRSEPEVFFPPGQRELGPVTVGIRCREPKAWLIYLRTRISAFGPVVVARRPLRPGVQLTVKDVELKEMDLTRIHQSYFDDPKTVVGKELKRPLAIGRILPPRQVAIPKAVKRGEQVIILAKNHGMQIRMKGTALSDGITGQRISVKNLSSNRLVEGTVQSPGVVEIQF